MPDWINSLTFDKCDPETVTALRAAGFRVATPREFLEAVAEHYGCSLDTALDLAYGDGPSVHGAASPVAA